MADIRINLPDEAVAFIEEQVAAGAAPTRDEYIGKLIRALQIRQERERIDALLQEGLDSGPAIPVDDRFWAGLHQHLEDQQAKRSREAS